jgi:hypothetical protein
VGCHDVLFATLLLHGADEYRCQSIRGSGTSVSVVVPEIAGACQRDDQLNLRTQDQKRLAAYCVPQVPDLQHTRWSSDETPTDAVTGLRPVRRLLRCKKFGDFAGFKKPRDK